MPAPFLPVRNLKTHSKSGVERVWTRTLVEVTPIDQFPWTGHLELVASFRR